MYINITAHQKFIAACHRLLHAHTDTRYPVPPIENAAQLQADLHKLQRIADTYAKAMSELPAITREYNEIQRRLRIGIRKIQVVQSAQAKKNRL